MPDAVDDAATFTDDAFCGGRLILRQPRRGHRAGHDAMLLAAAAHLQGGTRLVEFGAGVGAAGLAAAQRLGKVSLALVEIDPHLAALARHNAARNGIAADIVALDVGARSDAFADAGLPPDGADAVIMNPPFNATARHRASPDVARSRAHMADDSTLDTWLHAARRVLRPGGIVTVIWRAEDVAEVLQALQRGFGSVRLQAVHADPGRPASRILVEAGKGGRAPLALLPPLMLGGGTWDDCVSAGSGSGLPLRWCES